MQQALLLNKSYKYRKLFYTVCVAFSSFIVGVYFRGSYLLYLGFFIIIASILYECFFVSFSFEGIVLPQENQNYFKIIVNNKQSSFLLKRHIIINNWVYLNMVQKDTNKNIKVWLHKTNFKDPNNIRLLTKTILLDDV